MREELGVEWPYTGHKELLSTARAAIKAMRVPTEAMSNVSDTMRGCELCDNAEPHHAAAVFTAMIDAALEEGK